MKRHRRDKVFGPGRAVPLDRNAKARVAAYVRARSAGNRQPGQLLSALLWGFHNAHTGRCFPSYEAIATRDGCGRTVGAT